MKSEELLNNIMYFGEEIQDLNLLEKNILSYIKKMKGLILYG